VVQSKVPFSAPQDRPLANAINEHPVDPQTGAPPLQLAMKVEAEVDSDPSDPGNTMTSNTYARWAAGSLRPYSYVKSGIGTAFMLSPDTRLEITAYTNVGAAMSKDSGDATSSAGIEVFSGGSDGEPLDRVASQFSTVHFSGYPRLGGFSQFLTIDFDNAGTGHPRVLRRLCAEHHRFGAARTRAHP